MYSHRSADCVADIVNFNTCRNYSFLYPIVVDTFRVVMIPPRRNRILRHLKRISNKEVLFVVVIYLTFLYIARNLILEDPDALSFPSLIISVLYEATGRPAQQQHRYFCTSIARGFYFFYIFIQYVLLSSRIIALLTNSVVHPDVKDLKTIQQKHWDVVLTVPYHQEFPQLIGLTRSLLREPIQLTHADLQARLLGNDEVFAVIYSDNSVRAFVGNYLQGRDYKLVAETFGKTNYPVAVFIADSPNLFRALPDVFPNQSRLHTHGPA